MSWTERAILPAVSALVGGIVGGGLVWIVVGHDSTAKRHAISAEPSPSSAGGPVAADGTDVDARLARLERRSAAAQALGEVARAMNAHGGDGGIAKFSPSDVKADNPVFELAVRSVLDRVEWEKGEERKVEQQNQRAERAKSMSDYLAQKLSLSGDQKAGVERVFTESMEALRSLREPPDGGRAPQSRDEWRQAMNAVRTQTDQKIAQVLSPAQMQSYQALQEQDEEVRSWRRPPGRFGR